MILGCHCGMSGSSMMLGSVKEANDVIDSWFK